MYLVFLSIETYLAGEISIQNNCDWDSNLKIFLLPGLEAQKVENTAIEHREPQKVEKHLTIVQRCPIGFPC